MDGKCVYIYETRKERPMSKYQPLASYVLTSGLSEIRLRFSDIERLLGEALPPSARKYNAWWSNTLSHPIGIALAEAGLRTRALDLAGGAITIHRER